MKYLVQSKEGSEGLNGAPSVGPSYRSVFAKDGYATPIPGIDSCWDAFKYAVEKYPNNRMLGRREIVAGKPGEYVWQTYKEVYDIVMKLASAIRSLGIGKGDRCGIYGANCPEWIMSLEACNAHGLCCVPLYDTLGASAVEFIICHAEVRIAFADERKISELLKTFPASAKFLKVIVSFGNVTPEQREEAEKNGLEIYQWNDFLLLGQDKHYDLPVKEKKDICTIMYTSGSTGEPKGVMISNQNILSMIAGMIRMLQSSNLSLDDTDVYISYLPLAHMLDRGLEELFIFNGASIGFWRGDVKGLIEDMGMLKPTYFCAVPRVLERIYEGLQAKISATGFLTKALFNVAYNFKKGNMFWGSKQEEAGFVFDKLVFSMVKKMLGGRVKMIWSGGAPLVKNIEEFLRVVSCAHVCQGYGLTETSGPTLVALANEISMLSTVGPPLPVIDVRLESVPEMGYIAFDNPPRGEVCIRGDTVFAGYYKREDLTNEVLIDGWFHTGDIGEWQPDGALKVIDRKKNIFKLSQGEYVAVEHLENVYTQLSCIDSIWVYGNSFQSFLVAVVNPNRKAIENWTSSNGISGNFKALCEDPKVKEHMLSEISRFAREKKLKGFEVVRAVHLESVPFDVERDLLTPTYKKKRVPLLKYYQGVIDELYQSKK
ncbi:Long-Chain Acyl-CoA Synthetase [Rhynchospora pubera]|uniref:Long-chain-fatty-acid--CoA ligase n=1 Tax=Rhynchospora pubera TaxID=906938 RepID=A0AAV8FWA1_9POAL|nr:Long-Chain Acyl-CoA Synthetase [Rhynchospora pubera]